MDNVRIHDWDYLDLGEDSGSDNDAESSDDEIDVILHGTPEQKRKLRDKLTGSSESDSEFEMQMDSELEKKVKGLGAHSGEKGQPKVPPKRVTYDDPYDSDDDDVCGPKLSNDDLLYDPDMDDDDQKWVDSQRRQFRSQNQEKNKRKAAPNSDAILDCPACLTTLCIDCQRHSNYQNQYRAMFVMNCSVDRSKVLSYPEQSRKRGKRAKRGKGRSKQGRVSGNGATSAVGIGMTQAKPIGTTTNETISNVKPPGSQENSQQNEHESESSSTTLLDKNLVTTVEPASLQMNDQNIVNDASDLSVKSNDALVSDTENMAVEKVDNLSPTSHGVSTKALGERSVTTENQTLIYGSANVRSETTDLSTNKLGNVHGDEVVSTGSIGNSNIQCKELNIPSNSAVEDSPIGEKMEEIGMSNDQFYGVYCTECNTAVAVIDTDEVYHFYNVIPAYT